jgi:hypothetical protein
LEIASGVFFAGAAMIFKIVQGYFPATGHEPDPIRLCTSSRSSFIQGLLNMQAGHL